jgi:hypothetical protein
MVAAPIAVKNERRVTPRPVVKLIVYGRARHASAKVLAIRGSDYFRARVLALDWCA